MKNSLKGKVIKILPKGLFEVKLEKVDSVKIDGTVKCHLDRILRMSTVSIQKGQNVTIKLGEQNLTHGKIIGLLN